MHIPIFFSLSIFRTIFEALFSRKQLRVWGKLKKQLHSSGMIFGTGLLRSARNEASGEVGERRERSTSANQDRHCEERSEEAIQCQQRMSEGHAAYFNPRLTIVFLLGNCFVLIGSWVPAFAGMTSGEVGAAERAFAETYEVIDTPLTPDSQTIGVTETIITDTEIQEYQETFLKDSLPYAPSVILNSNGTQGRVVDFSIRGARSAQNLVLLDGIYVNDPASGGGVDLSNFLNADMERIEVLPGPQSLAFGPGALGGVIQLIPKKGHGAPSLKVLAEGGSFRTKYGTLVAQGEEGPLQFSATMAGFQRGPSSFTNPLHGNRQSDRYRNGTFSSRVGYALTDNWEVEGTIRYLEGKTQFDSLQFMPEERAFLPFKAPNFSTNKTLLASLDNKWGTETWDHSLKAVYSHILRKTEMPSFHNQSLGEHPVLLYRSDYKINSQNTLTAGAEGGQERAKEEGLHTRTHGGIYAIYSYKPFETTELKGGVRTDQYQSLGNRVTFNVGADQKVTCTTTLRASYGTNFKPPVLSDLFQKNLPWQVPNPFLKPEKSRSAEAGFDQTFFEEKVKMSVTGFMTQIEHVVLSRPVSNGKWQRYNGGRRDTMGLEIAFSMKPDKTIELKTAFTFTHARDFPGHTKSPFIPGFKGAGGVFWQALPDLSFFVQGYGVTSRLDSASQRKLAPYGVLHLGSAYAVNKHAALFWRIENVTNKYFEETFGYGSRGRAFFVGVEVMT